MTTLAPERLAYHFARIAAAANGGARALAAFDAEYPDAAVFQFSRAKQEHPEAFDLEDAVMPKAMPEAEGWWLK